MSRLNVETGQARKPQLEILPDEPPKGGRLLLFCQIMLWTIFGLSGLMALLFLLESMVVRSGDVSGTIAFGIMAVCFTLSVVGLAVVATKER